MRIIHNLSRECHSLWRESEFPVIGHKAQHLEFSKSYKSLNGRFPELNSGLNSRLIEPEFQIVILASIYRRSTFHVHSLLTLRVMNRTHFSKYVRIGLFPELAIIVTAAAGVSTSLRNWKLDPGFDPSLHHKRGRHMSQGPVLNE